MKTYVSILYILAFATGSAQEMTLSGRVTSEDDKTPIPYAHIALLNFPIGTITDIDGQFELSIKKNDWAPVIISSIGFKSRQIEEVESWVETIELVPLISELDEVTILAERNEELSAKTLVKEALKEASKLDKN